MDDAQILRVITERGGFLIVLFMNICKDGLQIFDEVLGVAHFL
jgi:hypothetical protein